jgi:release factor glutamine methyltransferase
MPPNEDDMPQSAPHPQPASVRESLRDGIHKLETAGTPSAALACELLLMHALVRDRAWLYAHPEEPLTAPQSAQFYELLAARAAGMPTQYLTGKQEFWGLELEVTPDVLIPRPETEHVVEVAIERIGAARKNARLDAIDVGTGSGCIAVALAKEFPEATIYATDISARAIAVATRNAARHNVAGRVRFSVSDLLLDIREPAEFDLIAGNPPYISRSDAPALPPDVRDHEPGIALFAGADGLDFYRPLIAQAGPRLKRGGILVLELGLGLFEPVSDLLGASHSWTHVSAKMDLAGIPRVISAIKA